MRVETKKNISHITWGCGDPKCMSPPCRLEADVSDKFIQVGLKLFMAQGTPPDKKICMMHLTSSHKMQSLQKVSI